MTEGSGFAQQDRTTAQQLEGALLVKLFLDDSLRRIVGAIGVETLAMRLEQILQLR